MRTEARKVNDLFFDILKIAFPETDFREARNSVGSFSGPVAMTASGSSTRHVHGQNKRNRLVSDAEPDPWPTHKPQTRGSLHATEDSKSRSHMSQKEARVGVSSSSREQDDPRPLTHPGELVICKKKRKDREKSVMKTGNMSGGPVSPTGVSRNIKNSGCVSMMKDSWLNQQGIQQQGWANQSPQLTSGGSSGGGSSVGWANPVKRMRTDAGRRRPSHL